MLSCHLSWKKQVHFRSTWFQYHEIVWSYFLQSESWPLVKLAPYLLAYFAIRSYIFIQTFIQKMSHIAFLSYWITYFVDECLKASAKLRSFPSLDLSNVSALTSNNLDLFLHQNFLGGLCSRLCRLRNQSQRPRQSVFDDETSHGEANQVRFFPCQEFESRLQRQQWIWTTSDSAFRVYLLDFVPW